MRRGPRRIKVPLPRIKGLASDEHERLVAEAQLAAARRGRGQPLQDVYLTEAEALRLLSAGLGLSESVVVGMALLELAASRGLNPHGRGK